MACSVCEQPANLKCTGCHGITYCSYDHQRLDWKQHKLNCKCYKLASSEVGGKYLVASRLIRAGQLILREESISEGPLSVSNLICLGCHSPIEEEEDFTTCDNCHWPVCKEECAEAYAHRFECDILARDVNMYGVPKVYGATPRYDLVYVLRCLLLRDTNPGAWAILNSMESHFEKRKQSRDPLHVATVRYLAEVCKVDHDIDTIHKVRGAIVTNALEVRGSNRGQLRALFPMVRLMNHSCSPNVHLSYSPLGFIEARAAVDVNKNESLSICYTGTREPLWSRQAITTDVYYFSCSCSRCKDPSEMGTHFSSINCPTCPNSIMSPILRDGSYIWVCNKCRSESTTEEVAEEAKEWCSRLDMEDTFRDGSVSSIKGMLNGLQRIYHPQSYFVVMGMQSALKLLNKNPSVESLQLRKELWSKLLEIYNFLEPGMTKIRAMTMYELAQVRLRLALEESAGGVQDLKEAQGLFKQAKEVFKLEPFDSLERKSLLPEVERKEYEILVALEGHSDAWSPSRRSE